jgi:hypothetical protein
MLDFAIPYINAFKTGATQPVIEQEMLVYWHRPHLKSAECDSTDNCGKKPTGYEVSLSISRISRVEYYTDAGVCRCWMIVYLLLR